jgi:Lamin Tail Domain
MNTTRRWGVLFGLLGLLLLGACSDTATATDGGAQGLRLNEVLAKSESGSDWLELYNTSDAEVSLTGLGLRDSNANWTFEEGTVTANGFVRVFCDDSGVNGRASFKLSSAGESLTLVDGAGATLDTVTFPAQKSDVSWGRHPDGTGEWSFLEQPSPAAANVKGAATDGGVDARPADAGATNAPCTKSTDCLSQSCHKNVCVSTYQNETGGACVGHGNCLSMVCVNKICAAGSSPAGSTCLKAEECVSGSCVAGACAGGAPPDAGASDLAFPDQG